MPTVYYPFQPFIFTRSMVKHSCTLFFAFLVMFYQSRWAHFTKSENQISVAKYMYLYERTQIWPTFLTPITKHKEAGNAHLSYGSLWLLGQWLSNLQQLKSLHAKYAKWVNSHWFETFLCVSVAHNRNLHRLPQRAAVWNQRHDFPLLQNSHPSLYVILGSAKTKI